MCVCVRERERERERDVTNSRTRERLPPMTLERGERERGGGDLGKWEKLLRI